MDIEKALKIIQVITCELDYYTVIIPIHRDVNKLLNNPRPGDLIFEATTLRPEGIGKLILVRDEWVDRGEEGGYNDTFWYIERLDNGELFKWYNCRFLRILTKRIFSLLQDGDPENKEWVGKAIITHKLYEPYPEPRK